MKTETKPTVRWGILSTASIATKVARAIKQSSNADLIAIASRTEERASSWAERNEVPIAYGSYDELLSDDTIDAVYIPLPPSMHAEWTMRAAELGKHILSEKPLCTNSVEAVRMAETCRDNNVQLMDGVMWVHHDRTTLMKQKLGTLGDLRRVTAAFTFNWQTIPTNNIRAKAELGGGSLGDLGYYCIRAILWAFEDLPTQVYATARHEVGVDFNFSGLLWFDGDRIATFDCGFDTSLRRWFEVAGTQGSLVCDDFTIPTSEDSARFWIHGGSNDRFETDACVQEVKMIERFSSIVQSGNLEPEWVDAAVDTMRVCDALRESEQTGEIVVL